MSDPAHALPGRPHRSFAATAPSSPQTDVRAGTTRGNEARAGESRASDTLAADSRLGAGHAASAAAADRAGVSPATGTEPAAAALSDAADGPAGAREARGITIAGRLRRAGLGRKLLVLIVLALAWEIGARWGAKPILFPTFSATMAALWDGLWHENLLRASWMSLSVLLKGYVFASLLALVLVSLAIANTLMREALQMLIAMFNPLPAIALLPLAMLWFGLGETALLVVLTHAVLWPFALATLSGFDQVPETQRLVGRNYGLRGPAYVVRILIPAALPSILYGLKIGWAFAWRTLIAAELVFGVSSSSGGLGWFIFRNRNELYTDKVFAGLAMVIIIGLLVEGVVFRLIEALTVRRWGTQR